jgi:hypothetical protein
MAINLTREQAIARLNEPERKKLLILALNEDVKSLFPMHLEGYLTKNDQITLVKAINELIFGANMRTFDLVFNEGLDS